MAKKSESDNEFLLRINKLKEDSLKKIQNESKEQENSKEYKIAKQDGQFANKTFAEIEECEKIFEEFKKNPPIYVSKYINDISVESYYEEKYVEKVEKLKKHHFTIARAFKKTSTYAPTFKTIGNVYIKRGGKKILLPQSSLPPVSKGLGMGSRTLDPNNHGFLLENKDLIITEEGSYFILNDIVATDKYRREVFVFPNSQLEVNITKRESLQEIVTMSGEKVPDVIQKNSSAKVIEYNFNSTKLISGIFKISFVADKEDVNKYITFDSGYPKIEFLGTQHMINNIVNKEIAKMPAAVKAVYLAKTNLSSKTQKYCENVDAFMELGKDKSIVIFGTGNSLKNKTSGKTASIEIPTSATLDVMAGKIIAKGNNVFAGSPDSRTKAIIKNKEIVERYNGILETKIGYELKLKELKAKPKPKPNKPETKESLKEKAKRIAEIKEEQDYYKKVNDTDMVMAMQMQLDELTATKKNEFKELDEEQLLNLIADCNKELEKLKPNLNSNFPSYNF